MKKDKLIFEEIRNEAKKNNSIVCVMVRGSYVEEGGLDKSSSDIDFSVIIRGDARVEEIINFKKKFNKITKKYGIRISSTVVGIDQIKRDLKRGIHLHGAISSSFVFQLARSKIIYGEDMKKVFSSFKHYDPYTPYFNAVRFIDKLFKDYFKKERRKKGINYSFILARECGVTKGVTTSKKKILIDIFKKQISEEQGKNLESIMKMRVKLNLTKKDLQIIYTFLKFCRDYLGEFLGKSILKDIKEVNSSNKNE
ncbi:MAG: hypothetical protein WDZ69_01590 [Candidatus Pacearchaeota archaeon]